MFQGDNINIFIAFWAGLLSFLSPCVLPLIPSYISYISGVSLDDFKLQKKAKLTLFTTLHSVAFVLGFTSAFIVFGLAFGTAGAFMSKYRMVIQKIGAVLIAAFGLILAGFVKIPFLEYEKKITFKDKPHGIAGSFLIGLTFAAGWTPCVGPVLSSILALASISGNQLKSLYLLLSYSAGLGIPFILSAIFINNFITVFRKMRNLLRIIHVSGGIILMIIGVLLYFDLLTRLSFYFVKIFGYGGY